MQQLAWDAFKGTEGAIYEVDCDGGHVELTLKSADELPSSGRAGGSFRLEFTGPVDPVLSQGIYRFRRGGDWLEIFIVPIGRDPQGVCYEAIFY